MLTIEKGTIKIVQGDTGSFTIILDNYVFVSGDKVYFTVKKKATDIEPLIQKVMYPLDGATQVVIDFLNSDTQTLIDGKYLYDIQLSLNNGVIDTIVLPSPFIVIGGVTHEI